MRTTTRPTMSSEAPVSGGTNEARGAIPNNYKFLGPNFDFAASPVGSPIRPVLKAWSAVTERKFLSFRQLSEVGLFAE